MFNKCWIDKYNDCSTNFIVLNQKLTLKIKDSCAFIEFFSLQITVWWSEYREHPLPPLSPPLWSLSAVSKSLGLLPSNTDFISSALIMLSLANSRFHRLMFPVIVLPVRNCLQDGAEKMERWPAAIQTRVSNCLLLSAYLGVPQALPKQQGQNWTHGLPTFTLPQTCSFYPAW